MTPPAVVARLKASPARETLAAAALAAVLILLWAAPVPLLGRDEARFAEAAREMLAAGELVVPTFAGAGRYDKPILVYWCTVASYALAGVDEHAARLPSGLAAVLTVGLLAAAARRRLGPGAGLLAGGLLATSLVFAFEARASTADMVMLAPLVAAMLAAERLYVGEGGARQALVLWAGIALATLAKGPVGLGVAGTTVLAIWALGRRWRRLELASLAALLIAGWWRLGPTVLAVPAAVGAVELGRSAAARRRLARLRPQWGVPLLLALVLPWAVAALLESGGEFARVGIGRHVVARSLTPLESHGGFPLFYPLTAVVAALPFFAFLPESIVRLGRRVLEERHLRFYLAWLVGPLVVLELVATKLVHYWLPSYPAVVLLVVAATLGAARGARSGATTRLLTVVGSLAAAAAPLIVVWRLGLGDLVPAALATGAPLLVAAALSLVGGGATTTRALATVTGGCALFVILLVGLFLPNLGEHLVAPRAAARAVVARAPGEHLLLFDNRDDELLFYLPLGVVDCRSGEELAERVRRGERFLALARRERLPRLEHFSLAVVDRIAGVELGRVRWVELVLFRVVADPGGGQPAVETG